MNANARSQELIAGNLAASNIPGFKKQELAFSAVEAGYLVNSLQNNGPVPASLAHANVATNFSQGQLNHTGLNTDLAIEGKGFFEVQLPGGNLAYTRDGEFQLNSSGELITKQGFLVMGEGGPIQLDRSGSGPVLISQEGDVVQGATPRGKIKVVEFDRPQALTPMSAGLFAAADPSVAPREPQESTVRQGFLEAANTSATTEMVNLISVMRAFEANQKLVQVQDERMGRVISELGTPN